MQPAVGPVLAFPDPLLDILLAEVVRVHRLAPPPADPADRFSAFLHRNLEPVRAATDLAITALLRARPRTEPSHAAAREHHRVFVEPSPYLARGLWHAAASFLTTHGWDVHLATRFREAAEPHSAA